MCPSLRHHCIMDYHDQGGKCTQRARGGRIETPSKADGDASVGRASCQNQERRLLSEFLDDKANQHVREQNKTKTQKTRSTRVSVCE